MNLKEFEINLFLLGWGKQENTLNSPTHSKYCPKNDMQIKTIGSAKDAWITREKDTNAMSLMFFCDAWQAASTREFHTMLAYLQILIQDGPEELVVVRKKEKAPN